MITSKPDKGNGCVVLDKTDCVDKMYETIGDTTKFTLFGPANRFDNARKTGPHQLQDNVAFDPTVCQRLEIQQIG